MSESSEIHREEVKHRLDALAHGPWTHAAKKARAYLKPMYRMSELSAGSWSLPMASVRPFLETADLKREHGFSNVLRAHWTDDITDQDEIDLRESLDQALTHLQLLELAIEMGYLPLEAVREQARTQLSELLWSEAARKFVQDYEYLSVGYLATRVDVDIGQGDVAPPPVKGASVVRFATVLAEHAAIERDKYIDEWLDLLDDLVYLDDEQTLVRDYFLAGRDPNKVAIPPGHRPRFERLAQGAERWLVRLSTTFDVLRDDEQARVGLLHSYWLAKFFGLSLGAKGYRAAGKAWDEPVVTAIVGAQSDITADHRRALEDRVRVLREAWDAVLQLVKGAHATKPALQKGKTEPAWIQIAGLSESDYLDHQIDFAAFFYPEPAQANPLQLKVKRGASSGRIGTVTIPGAQLKGAAKFLAAEATKRGEVPCMIVGPDGQVRTQVIKVPKGSRTLSAAAVSKLLGKMK